MGRGAHIALDHTVHYGIKVANPRKLNGLIMVALAADIGLEDMAHHTTLDALALELGRNAEDAVARLTHLELPHKAQLIDNAKHRYRI